MKTKRSLYNLFFNIMSQIVTFAVGITIPRLFLVNLGSETNGLVSSVGQIFSYVGLLEAGMGATVMQSLYKPIASNDRLQINRILSASNRYYKRIGLIYILCVCVVAIIYPLVVSASLPTWQIVCVVIFSGLGNAINFLFQQNYVVLLAAEGRGYVTANLNLFVNILVSVVKAVLLLYGFNIVVIIVAQFTLTLLRIALMQVYIFRNYKWIDVGQQPDYSALSKQKFVMVQKLSYFVYSNTDILVLTIFGDLTIVSVYVIYNLIIGVIEGIVGTITNSIVFALGQLYNEEFYKFKKIYNVYDTVYMTIVFSLFTVAYLCIIPFLSVYTRGITDVNYLDSKLAFLFVVLKMVSTLRSQSQNTIDFAGHFKETQHSAICETVLNIIISLVGVYFIGIYGVVIGSIISTFYRGISVTNYANKYILKCEKKEKNQKYLRWAVYILAFMIISFMTKKVIPMTCGSYMQWVGIAIPYTILVILIYFFLWAVLDKGIVLDAISIIKDTMGRK